MSRMAFLLGMFAVPLVLLAVGHGFRRRSARGRAAFWGGSYGYLAGVLLTTALALLPPIHWAGGAALRTFVVHWSMLLAAVAGAGVAWITAAGKR